MDLDSSRGNERARARWQTLRSAITQKQIPSLEVLEKHSIHRFEGFRLLTRRSISLESDDKSFTYINDEIAQFHPFGTKVELHEANFDVIEYETPLPEYFQSIAPQKKGDNTNLPSKLRFRTRERKLTSNGMQTKINLQELNSQAENEGVDNTGNIRVWDSSSTLAYLLLHGKYSSKLSPEMTLSQQNSFTGLYTPDLNPCVGIQRVFSLASGDTKKRLRVIELGAGMASLPSLLLWTLNSVIQEFSLDAPTVDVTITDGHSRCIYNNIVSAALTWRMNSSQIIQATEPELSWRLHNLNIERLLWKSSEEGFINCKKLMNSVEDPSCREFDLCLVSDCIHFMEHHAALAITIGRLLRVGGVCILCQPTRADSLRKFMELLEAVNVGDPLFETHFYEYYDEVIVNRHLDLVKEIESKRKYEPSLHYPVILTLRKCRFFDEATDKANAVVEADRIRKSA